MTILEIRDKLINDEIDYSVAFEHIKKLPKSWHTKDWAKKREKIIKSECEQCKNTEGVMVAQHLTHPPDFKYIRKEIFDSLLNELLNSTTLPKPKITKKDIKQFHKKNTIIRDACPHCKWIRIRTRKTIEPKYFCEACKVAFDEPIKIEYNEILKTSFPNDEQVTDYLFEKMEKEIKLDFNRKFYAENEKAIGKKALLISIDLHLKYNELDENVVTFCKRCASKMDLNFKLLCWNCKTDYFDYFQYDCCYKCYEKNEITKNPLKDLIWENIKADYHYIQNLIETAY